MYLIVQQCTTSADAFPDISTFSLGKVNEENVIKRLLAFAARLINSQLNP